MRAIRAAHLEGVRRPGVVPRRRLVSPPWTDPCTHPKTPSSSPPQTSTNPSPAAISLCSTASPRYTSSPEPVVVQEGADSHEELPPRLTPHAPAASGGAPAPRDSRQGTPRRSPTRATRPGAGGPSCYAAFSRLSRWLVPGSVTPCASSPALWSPRRSTASSSTYGVPQRQGAVPARALALPGGAAPTAGSPSA